MKFEMQNDYNIYVGLNDKETYTQVLTTDEAENLVRNIVCKSVGGATFSNAYGFWVDENYNPTRENTILIKIVNSTDEIIESICAELCAKLNQNCVMVQKMESQIAFV